jgi:hypothetical protein
MEEVEKTVLGKVLNNHIDDNILLANCFVTKK